MSRWGIEPEPPAQEASTLEKSHLDSLSAGYSEPLLVLRQNIRPLQYIHTANIVEYVKGKVVIDNDKSTLPLFYSDYAN